MHIIVYYAVYNTHKIVSHGLYRMSRYTCIRMQGERERERGKEGKRERERERE